MLAVNETILNLVCTTRSDNKTFDNKQKHKSLSHAHNASLISSFNNSYMNGHTSPLLLLLLLTFLLTNYRQHCNVYVSQYIKTQITITTTNAFTAKH